MQRDVFSVAAPLTAVGHVNGGDPIAAAYTRLAVRVFLYWFFEAKRGVRRHRRWLMSRDGEMFMAELGIDAQAARQALTRQTL